MTAPAMLYLLHHSQFGAVKIGITGHPEQLLRFSGEAGMCSTLCYSTPERRPGPWSKLSSAGSAQTSDCPSTWPQSRCKASAVSPNLQRHRTSAREPGMHRRQRGTPRGSLIVRRDTSATGRPYVTRKSAVAGTLLLLVLAAGCGGSGTIPVNSPTSPLGGGGDPSRNASLIRPGRP